MVRPTWPVDHREISADNRHGPRHHQWKALPVDSDYSPDSGTLFHNGPLTTDNWPIKTWPSPFRTVPMAQWLTKASHAFRRREPPAPEPFEITCDCGCRVAGLRRAAPQQLVCGGCNELVFVLPANVYPVPASEQKRRQQRAAGVIDEAQRASATATKSKGKKKKPPPVPEPPSSRSTRAETRQRMAKTGTWLRRQITPLRLILAGIVVVVVATGFWVRHRARRDQARTTARVAADRGREAIHDGDFRTASRELAAATAALDLLGRTDADAEEIRQLGREASAANNLLRIPLIEILNEAEQSSDAEEWATHFGRQYADGWLVFDAPVVQTADSRGQKHIELDFPLTVHEKPVRIIADVPALRPLATTTPRRVILAAQLAECRLVTTKPAHFEARLRPETAFLWSDFDSYAALGFQENDGRTAELTRQLLDEQHPRTESAE